MSLAQSRMDLMEVVDKIEKEAFPTRFLFYRDKSGN